MGQLVEKLSEIVKVVSLDVAGLAFVVQKSHILLLSNAGSTSKIVPCGAWTVSGDKRYLSVVTTREYEDCPTTIFICYGFGYRAYSGSS